MITSGSGVKVKVGSLIITDAFGIIAMKSVLGGSHQRQKGRDNESI
jgi:hypothetical protein